MTRARVTQRTRQSVQTQLNKKKKGQSINELAVGPHLVLGETESLCSTPNLLLPSPDLCLLFSLSLSLEDKRSHKDSLSL